MKLKGINITSLITYRNNFAWEEVWENIDNGVLLRFQKELVKQGENVSKEIVRTLEAYERKEELPAAVSDFFENGEWDLDGMERKLEDFSSKSRDHAGECFYSRNIQRIRKFTEGKGVGWDARKAALFYLFLLSMLQVNPRERISEEDFAWIREKLDSIPVRAEHMMENAPDMGICPYGSSFLFLKQGKLFDGRNQLLSPSSETIICFAYTEELGIIAFTEQGELSACMEPDTRYEMEEKRKSSEAEKQRVIMSAACGSIYVLLLENGNILTNVLDSIEGWRDIRWIGAGLNSITAITGNARSLLELGSDIRLQDFSAVKAAWTWSGDGRHRYAVLKENGNLIMDDGEQEENVDAAYIDQDGYLYAKGAMIFLRKFESNEKWMNVVQQDVFIVSLCRHRFAIYGNAVAKSGEVRHLVMEESVFQPV